jgi:hypothetical protein
MTSPIHIDPDAIYDDGALALALDLPSATIRRARREGRLRHTRRGRRTLYLGKWVMEWLTADHAERTVPNDR